MEKEMEMNPNWEFLVLGIPDLVIDIKGIATLILLIH